jgi:23S rRNA pseudouridine1911/1915/1917 synthase
MIEVTEKQLNKRVDLFLLEYLEGKEGKLFSRNFLVNNWDGIMKVNGNSVKQSYKLKMRDKIEVDMQKVEKLKELLNRTSTIEGENSALDILFENEDFLVIEKPKGMVVHPGIGNREGTLANYVKGYLEKNGEFDSKMSRAGLVHRLDKGVGGLIVFAKNLSTQRYLQEQFERHQVRKIYLAEIEFKQIKEGLDKYFPQKHLDIDEEIKSLEEDDFKTDKNWFKAEGYIARSKSNRMKMEFKRFVGRNGKEAISYIKPISEEQVLIVIKTGRMHQIRATLEHFGIGITGDTLYGLSKSSLLPEKIGLRSIFLGFKEGNGEEFTIIKY